MGPVRHPKQFVCLQAVKTFIAVVADGGSGGDLDNDGDDDDCDDDGDDDDDELHEYCW